MDLEKLEKILENGGEKKFRLDQIRKAVYKDGISSFSEMSNLSRRLRDTLEKELKILPFGIENIIEAENKRSAKALLSLEDGSKIETVLISPKPDIWSVCVSSQVGCPLGCGFCATGAMGFKRDLTAEEITDQVLFWRQHLKKKFNVFQNSKFKIKNYDVNNIVYMGMGEPFLNWENVKRSLEDLTDPKLFGFGSRSIAVSTAGVPEGIREFAKFFPQMNLAISLHFATDEKRSRYMPINRKYGLEILREVIHGYFSSSNRKIFIEYVMLDGINDSKIDAVDLARYVKSLGPSSLIHMNLIAYNETSIRFSSSSPDKIRQFRHYLEQHKINVTIRKSLGDEIQGACGQLAGGT